MAVKLSELYKLFDKKTLKLIAGKSGLDNVVRWVHMVEGISISLFTDEEELAFTTGMALQGEEELFQLVERSYEHNSSGMVINVGPFIKEIPKKVIEFCEEKGFPLFEVPWDAYIAKIMKKLCYQITVSDRVATELSVSIKNAIFFPQEKEMYISQLERYGFRPEWSYHIITLDVVRKDRVPITEKRKDVIIKSIEKLITHKYKHTFTIELNNKAIMLFANYSDDDVHSILKKFQVDFANVVIPIENFYISIGNKTESIEELDKSYKQALNALNITRKKNEHDGISRYKDLGIYKLLLALEDQKGVIAEYYEESLGTLEKYDELNETDYMEVLKCYLKHSGSIKAVAEELFFHKNTIGYKLSKIENLLGYNISPLDARMYLRIAFMLKDMEK